MNIFNNPRHFILLGCVAIGAVGLAAPGLALAEGKGASKLMFAAAKIDRAPQNAALAKATGMSCPRCTDGYIGVADKSSKGMHHDSVKLVTVHLCSACETKITVVGVSHSCGMNGSAGAPCCVASK